MASVKEQDSLNLPWYTSLDKAHPFKLRVSTEDIGKSNLYQAVACFPWQVSSLDSLWGRDYAADELKIKQWKQMVSKWSGVVAVGGGTEVRCFYTSSSQDFLHLFTIKLPDEDATENVGCIAWCAVVKAEEGFSPLLAFSAGSVIYVFNVENGTFHGLLRGHGGKINALAVKPSHPYLLVSASHDHTCRLYDLTLSIKCPIVNPKWPGKAGQMLAGPAFGMRANDGEGEGYGRCVVIFSGGPYGGHDAAVLGVEWHPEDASLATCGMDRTVKIWRLPKYDGILIKREDKPIFSSSRIHSAQVLSITWISQDILLSHNGPTHLRDDDKKLYQTPGIIVLWHWLGRDRFFPPNRPMQPILRGCASDFQESASYKILSKYTLPCRAESVQAHVYRSPYQTPLILLPSHGLIYASSIKHFKPRDPPPHPTAEQRQDCAERQPAPLDGRDILPCWSVYVNSELPNKVSLDISKVPKLEACTIGENGRLLIGVGEKGGIWIWRIPSAQ